MKSKTKKGGTRSVTLALVSLLLSTSSLAAPGPGHAPGYPPAGPGQGGPVGGPNNGDQGRQAAVQACQKLSFQDQVNRCLQGIQTVRYFDAEAARFCGTQITFSSNLQTCLSTIAEKEYQTYEIQSCSNSRFDDDRISCLRVTGRIAYQPQPGPIPGTGYSNACGYLTVPQVQSEISRALQIIQNRHAIQILQNIQVQLDRGAGGGRR